MTSREAYIYFLNLANKLNSNDSIDIDIGRFVLLYNKWSNIWLDQKVRKTKSTQKIDEVQQLVKKNVSLNRGSSTSFSVSFELPDDWFDHIGGYAMCTQNGCQKAINIDQVKNDNERLILFDANWRPDFDFEWLPISIGENEVKVFFNGFVVDNLKVDYYRYPKDIDIEGYTKADGVTASTNVDPELDDIYVNEILDLVVADVSRIYQNNEKVQLDINRIQQEQ